MSTREPRDSRKRSRSRDDVSRTSPRRRSRSPNQQHRRRHHHHSSSRHSRDERSSRHESNTDLLPLPPRPLVLPSHAIPLSKHDLPAYRNMFASYLDIQKQLDIDAMDEREVKGRWKSFMSKWNRGELAEGWYDPATKTRADKVAAEYVAEEALDSGSRQANRPHDDNGFNQGNGNGLDDNDDASDSDYGPRPPRAPARPTTISVGPANATFTDLALRDELAGEQSAAQTAEGRAARKQDRKRQREREEELVPRAAAGTRERLLEKRAEAAASNRAFAADREAGGGVAEVGEADLLGAGGADDYRQLRREQERRKTDKEVRREEVLRARAAEREERVRGLRDKEQQTMAMLQELARERFGGGGDAQ